TPGWRSTGVHRCSGASAPGMGMGPATASWASGVQAARRAAGAQRRERGAPGGDLVQQRVQRGGVVVARLQDGVVLELGQQRQRDLLAYVGHLQRPADQPQLLGCPGAADAAVGDESGRLVVLLRYRPTVAFGG